MKRNFGYVLRQIMYFEVRICSNLFTNFIFSLDAFERFRKIAWTEERLQIFGANEIDLKRNEFHINSTVKQELIQDVNEKCQKRNN